MDVHSHHMAGENSEKVIGFGWRSKKWYTTSRYFLKITYINHFQCKTNWNSSKRFKLCTNLKQNQVHFQDLGFDPKL